MSSRDRDKDHYRNKDRETHSSHGSEVKSRHKHGSSSHSSSTRFKDDERRRSKERHDSKRKKRRSRSRDKKTSSHRDRRHREKSASRSRSPHRRPDDERSGKDYKKSDHGRRLQQRDRSHSRSRSASRERERAREKNKQEVKLQMQRNYEEQLEKMRGAAAAQPPSLQVPTQSLGSKLVEQIQQRKLLFSKTPEETVKPPAASTLWKQTNFSDDTDGKMSAKFKRLMGMKDADGAASSSKQSDAVKKQEQYFADLEKQYEVARMTTHTQRGLGLGFGSSSSLR